jgi:predicted ester cyclase
VDASLSKEKVEQSIRAARHFYAFWDTGNPEHIKQAVAPFFIDNTLPPGRPQGPQGLLFASRSFRAAVPDLRCTIEDLLVTGDKVTARLSFTGTFTGTFQGKQGHGQPVSFRAIDILHVREGRIIEDWHLEDNLTFLQQIGAVPS